MYVDEDSSSTITLIKTSSLAQLLSHSSFHTLPPTPSPPTPSPPTPQPPPTPPPTTISNTSGGGSSNNNNNHVVDNESDNSETSNGSPHGEETVEETSRPKNTKTNQNIIGRRRLSEGKRKRLSQKQDPGLNYKICVYEDVNGIRAQDWKLGVDGNLALSTVEDQIKCVITTLQNKKWTYYGSSCPLYHVIDSSSYFVLEDQSNKEIIGIGFSSRILSSNFRLQIGKLIAQQKGLPIKEGPQRTLTHNTLTSPRNISPSSWSEPAGQGTVSPRVLSPSILVTTPRFSKANSVLPSIASDGCDSVMVVEQQLNDEILYPDKIEVPPPPSSILET